MEEEAGASARGDGDRIVARPRPKVHHHHHRSGKREAARLDRTKTKKRKHGRDRDRDSDPLGLSSNREHGENIPPGARAICAGHEDCDMAPGWVARGWDPLCDAPHCSRLLCSNCYLSNDGLCRTCFFAQGRGGGEQGGQHGAERSHAAGSLGEEHHRGPDEAEKWEAILALNKFMKSAR